ncbi:MAG: S-methyl-5-thioribose-1-phosphate isomerase [Thermoplasmata archaeon]|nr:S-methyl-5-thioribose-1-phosphate isomerase [Thermoplasmata archaeon]
MRVRALWWEDDRLALIDQRLLPQRERILRLRTASEVARAIRTMQVRGAPAIGVAAAYGMALAARGGRSTPERAAQRLRSTRPTAYDLFVGVETVRAAWVAGNDPLAAAHEYRARVVEECRQIGLAGADLFRTRPNVLTHCNAGALATVEWGTALAPLRVAKERGADLFVYVDETRPLLQGARLTAWELRRERIPHAVIADNAAGHFLRTGAIDAVIVGADRIARNGDFANKIGTYEKAVVARENGIPFYVAAPWSTFDGSKADGSSIPVEERHGDEVLRMAGRRTAPVGSAARNPAFDVTPSRYVTAFVTPDGVLKPSGLARRLARTRRPEGTGHLGTTKAAKSSRRSR